MRITTLAALALTACSAARSEAPLPAGTPDGVPAGAAVGGGAAQDTASVRAVLERPALVGRVLHVRGRCLGYAAARAAGPPPRTRSDWQLEGDGAAIWVTGPRPAGCSTDGGSPRDDVLRVRVAQDTIPDLGGGAGRERRFLVRVE